MISRSRTLASAVAALAVALAVALPSPAAARSAASACRAPARERFVITGRVHACGGALVDGAGHRVRLLSYEVLTMYAGEGDLTPECGHWAAPPFGLAEHVRRWGMNSVQIVVSWANIEPGPPTRLPGGRVVHHWNTSYLRALDAAIARFHAHRVAVVLTLGQSRWSPAFRNIRQPNGAISACGVGMPKWLYPRGGSTRAMVRAERRFFSGADNVQARFRHVWQMLAGRYRRNPGVAAAEMMFESPDIIAQNYLGFPLSPRSIALAGFNERTARAIHRVTPGLLVILTDWLSRTSPPYFALTRKPLIRNAAYSFEFYASTWDAKARTRLARFHDRAASWGFPAWIDEFDAFHYGRRSNQTLPVDPHWFRDTVALLAAAKRGRTGWSFLGAMDGRLIRALKTGH